ncbi:MAG: hypothetical protein HYV07_25315 [Deltaproteobacteria bacterium]|nr:hypothetical protein [Deltaproteobacteria bacterium]
MRQPDGHDSVAQAALLSSKHWPPATYWVGAQLGAGVVSLGGGDELEELEL